LAVPTLWGIGALAEKMDSGLIPEFNMTMVHWSVLVFLPVVVALIAMITARVTVMRNLGRML